MQKDDCDFLNKERWTKQDYADFCGLLASLVEDGYREFAMRGTPTNRPFLGVRIPKQRTMAKIILKGNWQEFLKHEPVSYEEVNVRGFVIAGLPYMEMKKRFINQVSLIDNWGNCDCFCTSLKSVKKQRADFLEVIDKELKSFDEFRVRAALVILLDHYLTREAPEYLQVVYDRIHDMEQYISDGPGEMGIRHDEKKEGKLLPWDAYYVKMAIAWVLAECYAKFPEETYEYLRHSKLTKWTYNKTISKICDSYRVDRDEKQKLKELRKLV